MKKDRSGIHQKLKAYSAVAGSIIAVSQNAQGQIIYTNITDQTVSGTTGVYNLDLNNAGGTDFDLNTNIFKTTSYYQTVYQVTVSPQGTGNDVALMNGLPAWMNLNDPIDNTIPWNATVNQMMAFYKIVQWSSSSYYSSGGSSSSTSTAGNWPGKVDKYLPLRITIGSNFHYGWARLDVDPKAKQFTIKDYAYESFPNLGIPAGATTSVGTAENMLTEMSVYSAGKNIYVRPGKGMVDKGIISVKNVLGEEIAQVELNGGTIINIDNATSGVYFVTVTSGETVTTKKVYIQ